jgi:RimJ/RimL family protein N-acetyltransferase
VVDLRLSGAGDEDLPLIRSWLTPEILDLIIADDLVDQRKPFLIIMIHDENDNKAGFFSVYNIDFINRKCEVGTVAGTKSCHKVTKVAIKQLLDILFNGEGMNRIYMRPLSRNDRAILAAQSVGFVIEGEEREVVFKNGRFENLTILSLLKKDFKIKERKGD